MKELINMSGMVMLIMKKEKRKMKSFKSFWMVFAIASAMIFMSGMVTGLFAEEQASGIEMDKDRPGMDYSTFDLQQADPKMCAIQCVKDPKCKAFTYVKPQRGVTGFTAKCRLKNGVPSAVSNSCCISGLRASLPQPIPDPAKIGTLPQPIPNPPTDKGVLPQPIP
jgi:hypothetical protein